MVLRLIPRSPRRRIRLVTVIGGLKVWRARSGPQNLRQFDTSNGCQDHTALPYTATSFVQRAVDRSRKTALRSPRAPDAAASTASRPNVLDDGQRPSFGTGCANL